MPKLEDSEAKDYERYSKELSIDMKKKSILTSGWGKLAEQGSADNKTVRLTWLWLYKALSAHLCPGDLMFERI